MHNYKIVFLDKSEITIQASEFTTGKNGIGWQFTDDKGKFVALIPLDQLHHILLIP